MGKARPTRLWDRKLELGGRHSGLIRGVTSMNQCVDYGVGRSEKTLTNQSARNGQHLENNTFFSLFMIFICF